MAETFPELKITLILIKASPSVKCQRICLTDIGNVIRTISFGTVFPISSKFLKLGSGCGSVGWAVASNSRGPSFESSHCQKFILNIYCQMYWKDENKEKEAWNGPFF